ncbi:MAG: GGDEF domain-containing protein [Rhizobacter sp.]|nr:GGDEF domain-containing protein [Rhizobacter sp.]
MSVTLTHDALAPPPTAPGASTVAAGLDEDLVGRRRLWLRECRFIAMSYVLNGLLLGLFALTGTASWKAGLLYAGPGLAVCAVVAWLIARGTGRRSADPSLSWVQSLASAGLTLVGVAFFPQLAFAYALMLFTVVLTATYRMSKAQVQALLVGVASLFAALTLGLGHRLRIPTAGPGEQFLSWLFFVQTLGRCVVLSVINTRSNRLLRERGITLKAKLAEIERLAHHDELTGVLNRRRMLQLLDEALVRHDRSGVPVTVALLDLDHFKAVNDTLGHGAGDEVLRRFAGAVQAQARNTDRFGRYGGEEFLVILHDSGTDAAQQAIARTRGVVADMDWRDLASDLHITFSAGIATYNGSETAELLLSRADLGLYEAKRAGRNCCRAL